MRKASAVHRTGGTASEARTWGLGIACGHCRAAAGAYADRADPKRDPDDRDRRHAAPGNATGSPDRPRSRSPPARPRRAPPSDARRSKPTIRATPTRPSNSPDMLARPRCSRLPRAVAISTLTRGTAEINSPASALVMCCSALERKNHGPATSTPAKSRSTGHLLPIALQPPRATTNGSKIKAPTPVRMKTRVAGEYLAHGHADQKVWDAPDHAHGGKQQQAAARHSPSNLAAPRGLPRVHDGKGRPRLEPVP